MKPNPFLLSHHFTLPLAIRLNLQSCARKSIETTADAKRPRYRRASNHLWHNKFLTLRQALVLVIFSFLREIPRFHRPARILVTGATIVAKRLIDNSLKRCNSLHESGARLIYLGHAC